MAESVVVRTATEGDVPGLRAVADHFRLLGRWPERPDFLDAERDFGTVVVAEVDGTIAGFGATLPRGRITHLGDLFVLPDHQSSGAGRMILSRLLPSDAPMMTFASADLRALALYVRRGMRPRCPLLYLSRPPQSARPAESARAPQSAPSAQSARPAESGHVAASGRAAESGRVARARNEALAGVAHARPESDPLTPGARDVDAAVALDARISGGERTATLGWFAGLPGVTVRAAASGYAFVRVAGDSAVIGPAGGDTPQACVEAVLEAADACSGAGSVEIAVPGTHPLLPLLLDAGWRIDDMDTLMTSEDLLRLDCYIPHPDLG
ncbi:GNAT family N-acetyltransferase [Microbispora cellulosiformans]|uniref:GNAT family N-acetyltransferase n=1 Tax=Microbispora cellulosiformans TaxID=2614688 RepID=A0A5J5JT43_9ACTN|nr:GNAT family N-acetyltransferase [Microbispora cellulosiformans]KAA9374452.1 GNAT family N-acetyltransferase [Microbispora cellulosiformans]